MAWKNLLTREESRNAVQIQTIEDFFKHPTVREAIKNKELDKAYQFCTSPEAVAVPGKFTEALYKSGINPFDYLHEDFIPARMFYDVEMDRITIPKRFNAAGVYAFNRIRVDTLIIENQSFLFDEHDTTFGGACIKNLYISPYTLSNIKRGIYFSNRQQPINIYLANASDYDMENMYTHLIEKIDPIFKILSPGLISLYQG